MTRLQYVDLRLGVVTRNHHFLVLPRSRRAAPRLSGGSSRARRRDSGGHRSRQRFEFYKGLGFSPQATRATWSKAGRHRMPPQRRRPGFFRLMAQDFYPVIARAIASLEQDTAEARQAVYDRARRVLREQVRDLEPALSPSERMDEMLALEEAIRKVELESSEAP